jgi:hypothetical protein
MITIGCCIKNDPRTGHAPVELLFYNIALKIKQNQVPGGNNCQNILIVSEIYKKTYTCFACAGRDQEARKGFFFRLFLLNALKRDSRVHLLRLKGVKTPSRKFNMQKD